MPKRILTAGSRLGPLLLPILAGCSGGTTSYAGYAVYDYFPLDGERTWTYAQEQEDILWRLEVEKDPQTSLVDTTEVVTLEYSEADGDLLYSVRWSSDANDGVLIHGWSDEVAGTTTDYDPPVIFGEYRMVSGESVVTDTVDGTFTSTFEAVEECPNYWVSDWQCLKMVLDDGDGDDAAGVPFAGTWWIAPRYAASRFTPTGYDEPWVLADASWASDD